MKKIIYLIIISIIISGCQAKYELRINKNLTVDETLVALEDDDFYNMFQISKKELVNSILNSDNMYFSRNYYQISEIDDENLYGVKIEKTYNDLKDFASEFNFYRPYFESFSCDINDNGVINISLSNKKIDEIFSNRYIIDQGEISIIVPFKVLKHNADKYDIKNNKYTWNFDLTSKTKNNIYIEFDTNEIAHNSFYRYILLFCCIILFLIFIFFMKKSFKRNKI